MELYNYKLTAKQRKALTAFNRRIGNRSWVLQRIEGTGLKFWRIKWSTHPDWEGEIEDADGKTFDEAIQVAKRQMEIQ